jgi:Zn-dependent M16 (insulinase) family peptidase
MTATVKLQISFEALVEAIATLDLENKQKLLEIIEDQIFDAEEDKMENSPEVLAEVAEARKAYQAGDYQTLEEYIANHAQPAS